jgi:WXG100 family type VII secretion target
MSTPTFGNNFSATQAGITAFDEAIANATRIDQEIEAQAAELAKNWIGDASAVYQLAVNQWRDGFNGVVQQLGFMVQALNGTVDNIRRVEQTNSDAISQLAHKLDPNPTAPPTAAAPA